MKWIETKVGINAADSQLVSELVADIFYDLGLKGVVMEDPIRDPVADWADDALPIPSKWSVVGYFADTQSLADICERLEKAVEDLARRTKSELKIEYRRMDEEDWAESWKEYFWPQQVTDSIVIKPTWRTYDAAKGDIVIEIDPGMAFGTGTHPTTSLCIGMIQDYLQEKNTFLDIGTGSGILMITAAKLGASHMTGIDNDEVAIKVAEQNLLINDIEAERFSVRKGDLAVDVRGNYDLVAANILSEVIVELLDHIKPVMHEKSIFIASGIIEGNRQTVLDKMEEVGLVPVEVRSLEEWVVIAATPG